MSQSKKQALALLEYQSVAVGLLAVDRMLKKSPVALLRCGTIHPGRYLALVGGSVASCEEAHREGLLCAEESAALVAEILLPDPADGLAEAVAGKRNDPLGDTLGVLEISTSAGLLGAVDKVLKAVPVSLLEVRLGDDLGGRSLAIFDGELTDVQEAAGLLPSFLKEEAQLLNMAVISRLDETLRSALSEGSRFASCRSWVPAGCEQVPGNKEG